MGMRVSTFIRYGGVVSSILGGGQDNYETDHEWTPCTAPPKELKMARWASMGSRAHGALRKLYENSTNGMGVQVLLSGGAL